jgi:hypothetical protein
MPPDVRDWLPDNHLVWFVLAAVEEMDLWPFYAVYRVDGRSRPAFRRPPDVLHAQQAGERFAACGVTSLSGY